MRYIKGKSLLNDLKKHPRISEALLDSKYQFNTDKTQPLVNLISLLKLLYRTWSIRLNSGDSVLATLEISKDNYRLVSGKLTIMISVENLLLTEYGEIEYVEKDGTISFYVNYIEDCGEILYFKPIINTFRDTTGGSLSNLENDTVLTINTYDRVIRANNISHYNLIKYKVDTNNLTVNTTDGVHTVLAVYNENEIPYINNTAITSIFN